MKKWTDNEMKFEELPLEVQTEIKSRLKAYSEVNVIYENGKYNASAGISIKANYAPDHRFIGVYYAEDVYTEEERIINYAESFHCFSPLYKGKRDYIMMNNAGHNWDAKFKMEDGTLIRI